MEFGGRMAPFALCTSPKRVDNRGHVIPTAHTSCGPPVHAQEGSSGHSMWRRREISCGGEHDTAKCSSQHRSLSMKTRVRTLRPVDSVIVRFAITCVRHARDLLPLRPFHVWVSATRVDDRRHVIQMAPVYTPGVRSRPYMALRREIWRCA